MKIGFVGLGRMGAAMAARLLSAGHELVVHNRNPEKAEPLVLNGARVARTPIDAARDVAAVVTMLANDAAVENVLFGDHGLLAGLGAGAVHVSSSTIAPSSAVRFARAHAEGGSAYVAAPVLGRPDAAARGDLVVLAAGPDDALHKVKPILDVIGKQKHVLGAAPEMANAVKLATNFLLSIFLEAIGEAFALTESYGVDDGNVLAVFNSFLKSPVFAAYGEKIVKNDFDPAGFALELGAKDVNLVVDAAASNGVAVPMANLMRERFAIAIKRLGGEKDWSAVARLKPGTA